MDTLDEKNQVDQKQFEEMLDKEKQNIEIELNKLESARNNIEQNNIMETDTIIENLNVQNRIPKNQNEGHKTPPVPAMGTSSLGLIASYGSSTDDDEDEVTNLSFKMDQPTDYRANDTSSEDESDTSSSDESTSSDSDSSSDDLEMVELEIENANNKKSTDGPLRVRGERLIDELPLIEDLQISVPETECVEIGKIQSIIAQLLLVESIPGTAPLDLDTVLFLENGARPLGKIFDVIGQITAPLYCVRFNSRLHIEQLGITIGMKVYCAPCSEHTSYVILSNIMNMRGSDASWENDIEADTGHQDYSDDEQERAARKALKYSRTNSEDVNSTVQQKTRREPRINNPEVRSNTRRANSSGTMNDSSINNSLQFVNPFAPQFNYNNNNSWHNNIPPTSNMPGPSYPNPYSYNLPTERYRMINFQRPPPPPGHYVNMPQFSPISQFPILGRQLPSGQQQFPSGPPCPPGAQFPSGHQFMSRPPPGLNYPGAHFPSRSHCPPGSHGPPGPIYSPRPQFEIGQQCPPKPNFSSENQNRPGPQQ